MKKLIVLVVLIVMGYSIQAQADLITIGTATYSWRDYNLIWDDDNNGNSIVWLDYTNNNANWTDQNDWALGLNNGGVLTYNIDPGYAVTWNGAWRLPTTETQLPGYNIETGEMGHLYYTELGKSAGGPLGDTGDFQHLNASVYWSGTEYAPNSVPAWDFVFNIGLEHLYVKDSLHYGLAVRSGDVAAVPEPTTFALLGIGLAGMAVYGIRRRRQLR